MKQFVQTKTVRLRLFRVMVSFCLCMMCLLNVCAAEAVPQCWNIEVTADDALQAAKQICLLYCGTGYWEKASIQTVGTVLLSEERNEDQITLCLYTSREVYDTSSGTPVTLAGSRRPVRMVLEYSDNAYRLLSYQQPEDGMENYRSKISIFGENLGNQIVENEEDLGYLAEQDALQEAENYIAGKKGVWLEFLQPGVNPNAAKLVTQSLPGWYPAYEGVAISYKYGKMYTLSIEGDMSYSGILTFRSFDRDGNELTDVQLQVKDERVCVLEGEMPDLYE